MLYLILRYLFIFLAVGGDKNLVLLKMLLITMGLLSFYGRVGVLLGNILYCQFTIDNKYGCFSQPVTLLRSCFTLDI